MKFYINGDKFFKGAVIAVSQEKFRTFDKLLEHLTRIMCNQVTLPNGVRVIYSLEGRQVADVDCLLNDESYVCSSTGTFKKLDYLSLGSEEQGQGCACTSSAEGVFMSTPEGGGDCRCRTQAARGKDGVVRG